MQGNGGDKAEHGVTDKRVLDLSVEVAIRLALMAAVALWCFQIFRPFVLPLIWAIILTVALAKPFAGLTRLLGGRRGLAAGVFSLTAIVLTGLVTFQVVDSVVHTSVDLGQKLEAETIQVPPPIESVRDWPLVGDRIYDTWNLAATNMSAAVERFTPQIRAFGGFALAKLRGLLGDTLHTIIALAMAGFMFAYSEGSVKGARRLLRRLGGERGAEMVPLIGATIRSVALGVLGIAVCQAALGGLGMFLVHVPGWGIWTVLILLLAVMQLPPLLILAPVIFWAFSAIDNTVVVIIFTVWSLFVSVSDTFLKPIFLGRGLDVPMPVILIGAIGGLILYGFLGLFVGAVVLAIGYELFMAWMQAGDEGENALAVEAVQSPEVPEAG